MKKLLHIFIALITLGLLLAKDTVYKPEAGSTMEKKKADWAFTPSADLPNVLILGDSISIGYTLDVRKILKEDANVYRPVSIRKPSSKKSEKEAEANPLTKPRNCQGTTTGVSSLESFLGDTQWDVIHFNWGLHDLKHVDAETGKNSSDENDPQQASPEKYKEQLSTIVTRLKETGAKLIFATTTPITPGTTDPLRKPEYPMEYNKVAKEVMEENNIPVNDLFTLANGQLSEIQKPKNCHFTPSGSKVLAAQVAEEIKKLLPVTEK